MATLRRRHHMPFGAEVLDDGRVRFRLWAPAANQVDVCLSGPDQVAPEYLLALQAEGEGWFSLTTSAARAGFHYRFRIDGDRKVPDPASRYQPIDAHGPSEVIDPLSWAWRDSDWRGRPWEEAVIYELHVGSFTPSGSFTGVQERLAHLADLGVTALELMPIGDFPGRHNWGYDGVCPFAPDSRYGRPDDLKGLIEAAHAHGLMVFLDVVYNHFGPDGNYLHAYAPQFFSRRHPTPWGEALNFDGDRSHWVRRFFIENALYWLDEYHLDGLRFDAADRIPDDSQKHILCELAERVHATFGNRRHVHLVLENDANTTHWLARTEANRPRWYVAQWNEDLHHVLHLLLSGETDGYYVDYANDPVAHLGRCLTEGMAYQGERSLYRNNTPRGEPSAHLPATAFVAFLQNHDQVGNRAFGERINRLCTEAPVHAAITILLLTPSPPLLFMGQEWGCVQPFLFFVDFDGDLADKVRAGRRAEFGCFEPFSNPEVCALIPDPTATRTFTDSVLNWDVLAQPLHQRWLRRYRALLAVRHNTLVPYLRNMKNQARSWRRLGDHALRAHWALDQDRVWILFANLGDQPVEFVELPDVRPLYTTHPDVMDRPGARLMPAWSAAWYTISSSDAP